MKKIRASYSIPIEYHNDLINKLGSDVLSERIERKLSSKLVFELIKSDQLYIKRSSEDNHNLVYESSIFVIDEVSLMKLRGIINENMAYLRSDKDYFDMINILSDK